MFAPASHLNKQNLAWGLGFRHWVYCDIIERYYVTSENFMVINTLVLRLRKPISHNKGNQINMIKKTLQVCVAVLTELYKKNVTVSCVGSDWQMTYTTEPRVVVTILEYHVRSD